MPLTTKIGLECKRRFWEEDDRILGGITRTDQQITQIWYPSNGYLGQRGVLTGMYISSRTRGTSEVDVPAARDTRAPMYLAGEHLSYTDGWQAGALESARHVACTIAERVAGAGAA